MWGVIAGVIQLIHLFIKNKFERDAELRKKKEEMYDEAKTAVKNRDISAINGLIGRMRE